ncbi:TolC family protein [Clostridium haemolyticum]|nr:TolC family protein [Clostridium haemolyticum]QPW55883.1 TolC family protein [Clostridium botulinum]
MINMKNKRLLKILTLGITSMFLGGVALTASAASSKEPLNLSRNEAVNLAINNSNDIKRVDTGVDTLVRKFKDAKDLSDKVKKLEDKFEDYKSAYKKINSPEFKAAKEKLQGAIDGYSKVDKVLKDLNEKLILINKIPEDKLTPEQVKQKEAIKQGIAQAQGKKKYIENQLKVSNMSIDDARKKYAEIQAKLAEFEVGKKFFIELSEQGTGLEYPLVDIKTGEPLKLSQKEEYYDFKRPQEIWNLVQCLLEKAVKQKELVKSIAGVQVNEAYTKILYGEDGYAVKNKLYERMIKGYNDITKSYEVGESSKLQKDITKISLDKIKLDVQSLKRTIESGKVQFKSSLGIDLTGDIQLKDKIDKNIKELKGFQEYLDSAFKNRYEIFSADVDVRECNRSFDTIKDYFCDDDYEWLNIEKQLDEAKIALSEAKRSVKKDIEKRYIDVKQKKKQIDMNLKNLEKAKIQLDAAKKSYEIGVKAIGLTWDAELAVSKAQMDYDASIRDYQIALYKLEKASGIGIDIKNVEAFKEELKLKVNEIKGGDDFS